MRIIRYIAFSFVFFIAFACQKEVIEPRHYDDSCGSEITNEPSRFGVPNNGGTINPNGGVITGGEGGITDPNQDEDQNKKKKNN
jgi:hypothetical protein